MFVNKKLDRFGRPRGHCVRLIDRVGLAEGDMNDEIFVNLHSSIHVLTLNPNKLVSNVSHYFKLAKSRNFLKNCSKVEF